MRPLLAPTHTHTVAHTSFVRCPRTRSNESLQWTVGRPHSHNHEHPTRLRSNESLQWQWAAHIPTIMNVPHVFAPLFASNAAPSPPPTPSSPPPLHTSLHTSSCTQRHTALHCGLLSDRGGVLINVDFPVNGQGSSWNLHNVWDFGLIVNAEGTEGHRFRLVKGIAAMVGGAGHWARNATVWGSVVNPKLWVQVRLWMEIGRWDEPG